MEKILYAILALIALSISACSSPGETSTAVATSSLESDSEESAPVALTDSLAASGTLGVLPASGVGKPQPKPDDIDGLQPLTWEILRDVTFEKKYYETEDQYFDFPTYGTEVLGREGKSSYLSGYLLPINPDSNVYVLSAYTFSSCFFCGQAGPESIVELDLAKKLDDSYTTDQWIAFKGTFRLNADDLDHLYYILEDAVELELE